MQNRNVSYTLFNFPIFLNGFISLDEKTGTLRVNSNIYIGNYELNVISKQYHENKICEKQMGIQMNVLSPPDTTKTTSANPATENPATTTPTTSINNPTSFSLTPSSAFSLISASTSPLTPNNLLTSTSSSVSTELSTLTTSSSSGHKLLSISFIKLSLLIFLINQVLLWGSSIKIAWLSFLIYFNNLFIKLNKIHLILKFLLDNLFGSE